MTSGKTAALVLGGGPAGSMFALTLSRAGHEVTLLEKSKEAHDKVCGEFLSHESLVYLDQHGLQPGALGAVPIRTVRLVTPWFQRERQLPFAAWSLTRRRLDEELLMAAQKRGVAVVREAHVKAVERVNAGWSAILRDGRCFQSEDVALATGKLDVGGWARPEGRQPHLVAFKMYYRLTEQQRASLGDAVELALYPGGYAGLQPVEGGAANLSLLIDSRRLPATGSRWDAVIHQVLGSSSHLRHRLAGATELLSRPLAASRIPYGHLQRETPAGLWRVGDQAAVIPSFCGGGTAIALHSGALAGTCLLQGLNAASYQRQLASQLSARMWFATRLSQVLIGRPEASQLTRVFPGLIRSIASITRIPDEALVRPAMATSLWRQA